MSRLTPKHPDQDFFIADIFNQTPFKDDLASMEHPVFVLSMKKDMRMIEYVNGNTTIQIKPSFEGLPNIFDKDFLMYCAGLLMAEINGGHEPCRTLRVSTHDFLVSTNRPISGQSYNMFKVSLDRLRGCTIKTNIKTNKREVTSAFGMIESYEVIESHKVKNRMIRLEVTLSEWFFNSVVGREMLTINRDYFRLRKPIERRLYEIARKHCGSKQKQWSISLEKLFTKTGSNGTLRRFKHNLKAIIDDSHIPDYQYVLDGNDMVTITRTKFIVDNTPQRDEITSYDMVYNLTQRLKRETITKVENLHADSYTDWSMHEIKVQFLLFMDKKGETIKSLDGAFLNFFKQKIKTYKKDKIL